MRNVLLALATITSLVGFSRSNGVEAAETVRLAETWNAPYSDEDANGSHIIAFWDFDADTPLVDRSGNGHDLVLNGGKTVAGGRFGGALESGRGWPDSDTPHQARTKASPRLTPTGAFTVEMWIKPKPEINGYGESFLLDNRYVDESGMQLILTTDSGAGRRLKMLLGIAGEHPAWMSNQFVFEPDKWYHIAFTYDGKGSGRFFVNGTAQGGDDRPEYGSVTAGVKPLTIGDRVGSLYHGFPGFIDQVRICRGVLEFRPATFQAISPRRVFVRMEKNAIVQFALINKQRNTLSHATASFQFGGIPLAVKAIPDIPSGKQHVIELKIDTSLRSDTYQLTANVSIPGERPFSGTEAFEITIVPRPLPDRMPVVMWGGSLDQVDWLTRLGFTHFIGASADYQKIWDAGSPTLPAKPESVAATVQTLDKALANGLGVVASLSPGRWVRKYEKFGRVDSDGKRVGEDACGLFPELTQFCHNVGVSVANTYGDHPAFQSALIHTEVRGQSRPCFHEHDRTALKAATGLKDIPKLVKTQRGTPYQEIPDFPADRVISDDDPLYVYYKWYWKQGDGWNAMHTALHDGLKSSGRSHLWTFHDPAVRVASVYGNGGNVDFLSHWTYSYPDPIRIGLCTDELFCMANGSERDDQQVMKMTQIIWYRSQTAPQPGDTVSMQASDFSDKDVRPSGTGSVDTSGVYRAKWERDIPDARFITIAPMHLREAFWTKLSRPIQGIMYHGWGSLIQLEHQHGAYRYTNPETKWELKRLVDTVVRPLGPTLKQVADRPSDVAFLESFASQMFARRGTYGWNGGWEGDAYLILQYAGLQTRVIYEETIQQEGLDNFKVLVMPACDVLPKSVVTAVKAFQNAGGTIVADENLCPAIKPDILLPTHTRPREADTARNLNIAAAVQLRQQLASLYQHYAESSTPDVITRVRRHGTTDYLFAVNDRREFGDYVGHHGLVMENGLPTDATLTIRRAKPHIYNLLTSREITSLSGDGVSRIEAKLGPCEGRVFMLTDHAIARLKLQVPESVAAGHAARIDVTVVGDDKRPLDAVVPVKIDIIDPEGRAAEFSGYYGAKDGHVALTADVASNDVPGLWRIHVQELASGQTADAYMRVVSSRTDQ